MQRGPRRRGGGARVRAGQEEERLEAERRAAEAAKAAAPAPAKQPASLFKDDSDDLFGKPATGSGPKAPLGINPAALLPGAVPPAKAAAPAAAPSFDEPRTLLGRALTVLVEAATC